MKRIIKNNYKIMIGIVLGILLSVTSVYAIEAYIESNKVSYDNKYTDKNNVQEAIDELYEKSGIHKEKWIDPILNGADPVLKSPLIPVEIKPNGDIYYANLNSEWYNYSEKRWANAVILIDNPSNNNYQVGDHILESDIESYFVWIPRYQYRVWNLGNYNTINNFSQLENSSENVDTAIQKMFGNTKIIDIKFGTYDKIVKMNESEASVDKYYTHPAFTLGNKDLNGFWVGKFETGYKGAEQNENAIVNQVDDTKIIIKPNTYTWRGITLKNMFMNAYNYKNNNGKHNENIDPHMVKNTEWGAVAYLSHSLYGIGNKININNASDNVTGFSSYNADQSTRTGVYVAHTNNNKTQPYNTLTGYLASTTGNISGIYDMSGGSTEYVASCVENKPGNSTFTTSELSTYAAYIDKYKSGSTITTYNNRILGDATGEMGPFYLFKEGDNGSDRYHDSWYSNFSQFIADNNWFHRGGLWNDGVLAGIFYYTSDAGALNNQITFRLALAPN